jgi:arylsulfatase
MTHRKPLLALLASLLLAPLAALLASDPPQLGPKPNIVLILADDLGYGDVSCYHAQTPIRTPHLDRMAAEGMRFTSYYAQPFCGPSRAALMTGCYPLRVAEIGNKKHHMTVPHGREMLLSELLKRAGYATAQIGKWDLAGHAPDDFEHPENAPLQRGFDLHFGTPASNDQWAKTAMFRDGAVIENPVDLAESTTQRYADEAIRFIRQKKTQPFFIYLCPNMPHTALHAGAEFRGHSPRGLYGDVVEELDHHVGRILDTLRCEGLAENTLVFFTSDNGPWLLRGDDGGGAGPLRGGKTSTWEGGVRVPAIAWAPGRIAPRQTCARIASTLDLLPTVAALAGAALPENQLDGRDISAWLRDGPPAGADDAVHYYHVGTHLQAVRQGRWKLHLPRPYPVPWLHPGIRRAHVADADRFEIKTPLLYDLDIDVGEKTDVAAQHPEVVQTLLTLAEKARAEIGDYDRVGSGARFFDDGPKRPDRHAWKSEPAPKVNKGRAEGASSAAAKPNVVVALAADGEPDAIGQTAESPRPAKVKIGPRELVRARRDMPFVMDSSLATLRRDQDSWFFYHTVDWGNRIEKWRGTPANPFQAKVWQKSRDELFDLRGGYANVQHAGLWLLNIHRLPDGNLLGVVHVELHPGKPAVNRGEKYALGLVFSSDGGERWVFCGEIVRPQNPHGNVGGAPWLVVGDYFHVYFNDDGPTSRRAAVARAPVAEVLNAARRGEVTPWRKFSDGAWEQDGLTGYGSAILPQPDLGAGHPLDLHADAAWNRALGKYMLTSWCAGGGVGRLYLHVSDDGIRFEPPILVDEEPGQWMPYSTFLTDEQDHETDDVNSVGAEFFLLINHKSATNYSVDSLWRRRITVAGTK